MKNFTVCIKSHSESPDYEATFSEDQLKSGICPIPYADDVDEFGRAYGIPCEGKLIPLGYGGFKCSSCQAIFELEEEGEN
jgi:hypothetical protein